MMVKDQIIVLTYMSHSCQKAFELQWKCNYAMWVDAGNVTGMSFLGPWIKYGPAQTWNL